MTEIQPKIFVQIAAYRDPECIHTIRDLLAKAKYPKQLNIAVCWQYIPVLDDKLFELGMGYPTVLVDRVEAATSKGVCWARHRIQQKYSGEEYTLMIDSHMRFVQDWDELLINELKRCESAKPILSNRPASYTPPNNLSNINIPTIVRATPFKASSEIRVTGELLDASPEKPLKGAFLAAGYIFTLGKFIQEIPYDPYHYFDTEEICLSARAWTHGWDIFSPSKVFAYHLYISENNRKTWRTHWSDNKNWTRLAAIGKERYQHLLEIKQSSDPEVIADISIYSLGKERSLKEYEDFCGLDFKNQIAGEKALTGKFVDNIGQYKKIDQIEPIKSSASKLLKITEEPRLFNLNMFNINSKSSAENPPLIKLINNGLPPNVMVLENYVPREFCKFLCDYADSKIGTKLKVTDNKLSTKDKYVSMESEGRITEHVSINDVSGEVISIFNDIYTRRVSPFFGDVKFEWYERPQILRYLPGGKYDSHADSEHFNKEINGWKKSQDRDYSVLLYLNQEFEGGMLNFVDLKYKIKPKTGMVVAFPSDHRYLHAAEPTTSGRRYAVVSWASALGVPKVRATAPHASISLNLK